MDGKYIKDKIENSIPKTTAEVTGDGTHFEATIVSVAFEGKSTLERHKMVYSASVSYTHLTLPTTPYV